VPLLAFNATVSSPAPPWTASAALNVRPRSFSATAFVVPPSSIARLARLWTLVIRCDRPLFRLIVTSSAPDEAAPTTSSSDEVASMTTDAFAAASISAGSMPA
jgi:hypothetical protein